MKKKIAKQLYDHFEELADKIGITIIDGKGDFSGGYCTVIDDQFIVLNKLKPLTQRLRVLAESFSRLDVQKQYLIPVLREFIEENSQLDQKTHL